MESIIYLFIYLFIYFEKNANEINFQNIENWKPNSSTFEIILKSEIKPNSMFLSNGLKTLVAFFHFSNL